MTLLPVLFPDDGLVSFAARHSSAEVEAAWQRFGLAGTLPPVVLDLPRPLLYDSWHLLGWPPLPWRAPALAGMDLVHAPSVAVPPVGRAKLVVTVHDVAPALFPEAFPRRGRWFHQAGLRAAAKRADLVITVSQSAAAEITAHTAIPAGRIRVIPNGVDGGGCDPAEVVRVRDTFGLGEDPYVLWVGSLEPRKGVGTLATAMASLPGTAGGSSGDPAGREAGSGVLLVLVGDKGWLNEEIIAPADRQALGSRFRLLGRVGEDDLRALYAGAAVFAFPSLHEGFGLPVLEAMAQGVPVVCSDIPVLREVAGDAAVFVAPGRPRAWAEAIEGLLGDEPTRRRLGAAGVQRAARFSWEATIRATHDVYREVVG